MTKQTWTAAVSAALFVVLAALIALIPVPYVTWAPGSTADLLGQVGEQPAISISGAKTFPTNGELRMTTVSVTAPGVTLSLPEVLFSYWLPAREVLPKEAVYQPGKDASEISEVESQRMSDSQADAVVAGLRQSGVEVTSWPQVVEVFNSGASAGILEPGDLIKAVDGTATHSLQEVNDILSGHHVGDAVLFTVLRNDLVLKQTVTTRATANNPDKPIVGILLDVGYSYAPTVDFAVDPAVGGSSAGLMFALAISDKLVSADITAGRVIAGTGTVDSEGNVGAIGGVQEKIAAALKDHATVFVLPKANCSDASTTDASIRLVPVETLAEATDSLTKLADPAVAGSVVGC
ncbi:MAG TPA: PDZ domain-containing protein [Propionicimonas sp.]|nr:PDZ domain-containing protein [Propionicimonas sp.]HRA04997.1 PDZ domain-containing protein [Propionicimonas sp.]